MGGRRSPAAAAQTRGRRASALQCGRGAGVPLDRLHLAALLGCAALHDGAHARPSRLESRGQALRGRSSRPAVGFGVGGRGGIFARRLLRAIFVLWGTSTVVFFIIHLSGDPIALLLPPEAGSDEIQRVRHEYGFDQPIVVQYAIFLAQLLQGDFGRSIRFGQPAMEVVLERVPATLELAIISTAVALLIALPVGVFGALRANTR